jgi:hypothetical protein
MKSNRDIVIEDGSNFEELIDALIVGPDSCCWTQSAKQIVAGVLLATQKVKRDQAQKQEGTKRNDRSKRQRK